MAGVGALICSLLSSIMNLLPEVRTSVFAPSTSSSGQSPNTRDVEDDLNNLVRTLKRIKATLYDAEKREIRDFSVKLWLKELKEIGHAAEYVIDKFMYEVYRSKVEARNTSELNPHKREQEEGSRLILLGAHSIRVPDGIVNHIREIRCRFDEVAKDREALHLHEEDGLRYDEDVRSRVPSSHLILEPIVVGRERDMEKVIDLVFSSIHEERIITIVPIVGMGGLGKTTLAQRIHSEGRVKEIFLRGWSCVSENFNIARITQDLIESFTGDSCALENPSALHDKIRKSVEGEKVFIVLDDVWNEDKNSWELFFAPFKFAVKVVFIVTTRSDRVAKILQTTSPIRLGYLPEKESWLLFQQHAFGGIDHNVDPKLVDLGRKIAKKCGGLPLALKVISNLLRYENEESWIEILENDLWEIHAENDIFRVLQISYTHMPMYLRPCFLYCSLFPKNYKYEVDELVELWIAQGYIESDGRKSLEKIAFEYAVELRERSFFNLTYEGISRNKFEMHDLIHDLARLNSENEFYSIKDGKQPNPPDGVLHIYMDDLEGLLESFDFNNVARVRTFLLNTKSKLIDFPEAKSLRVLRLNDNNLGDYFRPQPLIRSGYSIFSLYHLEKLTLGPEMNSLELEMLGNLINLKFLSLSGCNAESIPESLCFLTNLRKLSIKFSTVKLLPENIGNLICLQKLVIQHCSNLRFVPKSLCKLSSLKTLSLYVCRSITKLPDDIGNLTNLQNLNINYTGINYLPCSFSKLNVSGQLNVGISQRLDGLSDTVNWLNDFNILKGTLAILQLKRIPHLEHARNFNLINKPNLEKLILSWGPFGYFDEDYKLRIELGNDNISEEIKNTSYEHMDFRLFENIINDDIHPKVLENLRPSKHKDMDLRILESLKPHPKLKHLCIYAYTNPIFPEWMGDHLSCASLEKMNIRFCKNITYLPSGNLKSLKWLKIQDCTALQTVSLPPQLQSLTISRCYSLLSIIGMEDHEPGSSSSGFKNQSPLKDLDKASCPNLQLVENDVLQLVHCDIEISDCPGLEAWCLRHNITNWSTGRAPKSATSEVGISAPKSATSEVGSSKPKSANSEVGSSSSVYKKLLKKIKKITCCSKHI